LVFPISSLIILLGLYYPNKQIKTLGLQQIFQTLPNKLNTFPLVEIAFCKESPGLIVFCPTKINGKNKKITKNKVGLKDPKNQKTMVQTLLKYFQLITD